MKYTLIALLVACLAGCGSSKPQTPEEQMVEMKRVAAQYPVQNDDLADYTKYLIMTGNGQKIEYFYLQQYQRALSMPNRDAAAPGHLYQIFLAMIDPYNQFRSFNKARKYEAQLRSDWPKSGYTAKAHELAKYINL